MLLVPLLLPVLGGRFPGADQLEELLGHRRLATRGQPSRLEGCPGDLKQRVRRLVVLGAVQEVAKCFLDRKSTRLNSSHMA